MAFWPPSVNHAEPSRSRITPCGAEPRPSGISSTLPVFGSSRPALPLAWPENHTGPSGAGSAQTSCAVMRGGSGYSCTLHLRARAQHGRAPADAAAGKDSHAADFSYTSPQDR